MSNIISRRGFLLLGFSVFGVAAGADLLAMVTTPAGADSNPLLNFGKPEEYSPGTVTGGKGAWLIHDYDGFFALSSRCSHLGCQVQWDKAAGRFQCPCHQSRYDLYGRSIAGPAAAPLQPVLVFLDRQGNLVVNLKQEASLETRLNPGIAGKEDIYG